MNSIGYDIVDLSLTDPARTALPGFYGKILHPHEYAAPDFLSFHRYVWLCWSVKEAVYKYACRLQPGLRFSPTRIVLESLDETCEARVRWGAELYYTRTEVFDDYLATVTRDAGPVRCECQVVATDPSKAVRELVLGFTGPSWSVVRREDGCPTLVNGSRTLPVSFSHHGSYMGYSLVLP